jgi:Protein of unknown function (DUF3298)
LPCLNCKRSWARFAASPSLSRNAVTKPNTRRRAAPRTTCLTGIKALLCPAMKVRIVSFFALTASLAGAQGPLRFELKRIEKKTERCVVTFEYPEVISAASLQARDGINAGILRVLLRRTDWPAADSGFHSLDAYAGDFMKYCAEFQNGPAPRQLYEHKRVTIFRYTPPVLSFKIEAQEDGGGVHPFGTTFFVNFERSTGKTIGITDLLRAGALPKLEAIAEANFRHTYKLSATESLAGYSFPDDRLRLNDNFGIGEKQLVFLFNTYEIGPGAMDVTEIRIPYQDISNLLKINLPAW